MDKIKSYLPVLVIIGIIVAGVKFYTSKKESKDENIVNKGIKTEAIIENIEKLYYKKNKVRQKQFYYDLTLKYSDKNGKSYKNKASIQDYNFKGQKIGEKIEIFYLPKNPNEIVLADNRKATKTEGRLLLPTDLLVLEKSKNLKSVYNELNKISSDWVIDKNDSTLFLNKKMKSFIYVRPDSITYYNNSLLMVNNSRIEKNLSSFKKVESKRVGKKPINIDIFNSVDKPTTNLISQKILNHYQRDNFNFYVSELNDYSNKAWFSIVLKKRQ